MLKRIYELFIKLISVKGMFVIITTTAYFLNKIDYWYVLVAWSIFIGSREAYKLIGGRTSNLNINPVSEEGNCIVENN